MKNIWKRFVRRALLFMLTLQLSVLGFGAAYYVSNTGNDANSGLTTAQPWKTLAKVNAVTFAAGDQILFQRGSTFYGTLTVKNSGTAGSPIVYGAYGAGENPVITGFTTVTGWTNEGGGIYSKVITSESQTNMVTIDGVQYGMGRYPNSTFLTYESASTFVSITDNQLTASPNWTGAEAVIYKKGYRIERDLITNHSSNTLTYSNISGTNMDASGPNKYFIQNDLRTLDAYGEWYHNTTTGKFYMYFGVINPTTKVVNVGTLNNVCKVNTAKTYILIDGLSFKGSINNVVIAEYNCNYLTIQNCNISFAGTDGVYIDGQYPKINNCIFNYCNRISILSVGINATITNNSISNNAVIIGQGNTGYSGTSALIVVKDNATVTGNSIQNTGTNGIFIHENVDVGLVKNNYIYNTCIWNWDHGAIYISGIRTALTIDGNIIDKSGGNGIFLDAPGGNIIVKNNSITDCALTGLFNHQQNNNILLDNTVYNCKYGLNLLNSTTANNTHHITSTGNIFVAKTSTQVSLMYYTQYSGYAEIFPTFSFSGNIYARPIDDNNSIYYNALGFSGYKTLDQWKIFSGQDANSKKSPQSISSESDLRFEYNASSLPKTISLPYPMIDIKGIKYIGSLTLQPYTSVVLIKDANPDLSDATAPVISTFEIPSTSTSLTVPVTTLSASDNSGVSGYLLTETSTKPSSTATEWPITKPTSYTFDSSGTKSLYAWAKDAAGNISVSLSDQVVISLTSTANTLGNTGVYSGTSTAANRRAMPVTFTEAGSIQSITIYHNGGTGNVLLGVYSDQNGLPSTQLGVTTSTVINTTAGWQTVSLTSPVTVASGQKVWLAWVFQNSVGVRYMVGTPGRGQSTATWSGGMPTTFGASTIAGNKFSVYCTYTESDGNLAANTLGNTEVYAGKSTAANLRAMPVTFTEAGSIQSISIYHNGGTGNVLLGVYSDQNGTPSSQLGVTSSTAISTTAGWQTVSLTNPVTVASGQKVWLAWVFQNNPGVRYTIGTPGRAQSTATWTGGMPTTFGASTIAGNKFSIYCTYTVTTLKNAIIPEVLDFESVTPLPDGDNIQMQTNLPVEGSINPLGKNDFKLYPNPAKSFINVDYTDMPDPGTTIEIIDGNGRTIYKKLVVSASNRIDTHQFKSGIYFIRSINKQKYNDKKLIIQ